MLTKASIVQSRRWKASSVTVGSGLLFLKGSKLVFINLKHEDDHVPYWSIDIPPKVKDYVAKNPELRPTQVSCIISDSKDRVLTILRYGSGSSNCLSTRKRNQNSPGVESINFG
jgi:hypothetical protein